MDLLLPLARRPHFGRVDPVSFDAPVCPLPAVSAGGDAPNVRRATPHAHSTA